MNSSSLINNLRGSAATFYYQNQELCDEFYKRKNSTSENINLNFEYDFTEENITKNEIINNFNMKKQTPTQQIGLDINSEQKKEDSHSPLSFETWILRLNK